MECCNNFLLNFKYKIVFQKGKKKPSKIKCFPLS